MAAPPNPQQLAALQQQIAAEAAKRGISPAEFAKQQREQLDADAAKQGMSTEQYVAQLRARTIAAQRQSQGQAEQSAQGGTQVPLNTSNPADPKAVAVAQFLRSQELKPRTCLLNGQRKDMFKGASGLILHCNLCPK